MVETNRMHVAVGLCCRDFPFIKYSRYSDSMYGWHHMTYKHK